SPIQDRKSTNFNLNADPSHFDCARTVKEMLQLAEESKAKKTPMEAQCLKIFYIFCKI
ncbi:Hypothetical protein FKW44_008330, partial [Caligus rogercresseyi]